MNIGNAHFKSGRFLGSLAARTRVIRSNRLIEGKKKINEKSSYGATHQVIDSSKIGMNCHRALAHRMILRSPVLVA